MQETEVLNQKENAQSAELPKWDEFVTMVETENTEKAFSSPSAYAVYHKYSKTC